MKIRFLIFLFASLFCLGCTDNKARSEKAYKNIDQCKMGENCSLKGILTLVEIDHVLMGKLKTKDISCINVSLPQSFIKRYSPQKEINVTVTGYLYKTPILSEDDLNLEYRIDNRKVGWTQCLDVYLFVNDIKDIQIN